MKEKTFITITRQYGSGGLYIAEALAKKMGVKCYNRNIVAAAAESLDTFEDVKTVVDNSAVRAHGARRPASKSDVRSASKNYPRACGVR